MSAQFQSMGPSSGFEAHKAPEPLGPLGMLPDRCGGAQCVLWCLFTGLSGQAAHPPSKE